MSIHDKIIKWAIKHGNSLSWVLLAVYASPKVVFQNLLRSYLELMGTCLDVPWLLLGDWNRMLVSSDKQGGSGINRKLTTRL